MNNFLKGELAKLREPNGDFIVFFTKNGEPVYRNKPEAVATPLPPQLGDIHFVEGENAVAWNVPGAVPAGLYIYRIRAGENVKTGKVFVAR